MLRRVEGGFETLSPLAVGSKMMHLSLLQDPNGQPRAEGTRLATGVKGRVGIDFPSRRGEGESRIRRLGTMGQIAANRVSRDKVATQWRGVVTRGATRNQGEKDRIVRTRSQLREPQRTQESRVKGSAEAQSQVAVAVCKSQFTNRRSQSQFAVCSRR